MSQDEMPRPPSPLSTLRDFIDVLQPKYWRVPPSIPGVPRGDGHPVLFAPGIGSADYVTAPVRAFYRALGYETFGWQQGLNLGPTRRVTSGLERRLFSLNDRFGRRVSLVGRSLGGVYLRELAKAHPDRVRRLVLICSPVRHPVPSHLSTLLYWFEPYFDPDYPRRPEDLNPPAAVPTTSFYTRLDGYLAWQSCLEEAGPMAENIELPGAYHCTAAMHPLALETVARRLALADRP